MSPLQAKTLALSGRQTIDWLGDLLRSPASTPPLVPIPSPSG